MNLLRRLCALIRNHHPEPAVRPKTTAPADIQRTLAGHGIQTRVLGRGEPFPERPIHVVSTEVEQLFDGHLHVLIDCEECDDCAVSNKVTLALAELEKLSGVQHVVRGRHMASARRSS